STSWEFYTHVGTNTKILAPPNTEKSVGQGPEN
ncbi:MAG: hypothetical protein ACI9FB_003242, partial [Candidatus Azotimanducaceae bacterium]